MKRLITALAVAALAGCSNPFEPELIYPSYFLSQLDGNYLPAPLGSDGTQILSASLWFGNVDRPRGSGAVAGTLSYRMTLRLPDQSQQSSTIELAYRIEAGLLRINLCPPLALCIASTELVGPVLGPYRELVLTHYLGGTAGSVYSFFPVLPD